MSEQHPNLRFTPATPSCQERPPLRRVRFGLVLLMAWLSLLMVGCNPSSSDVSSTVGPSGQVEDDQVQSKLAEIENQTTVSHTQDDEKNETGSPAEDVDESVTGDQNSSDVKGQDNRVAGNDPASESNESFDDSEEQTIEIPDTWKRLFKSEVWADFKKKQVIVGGYICFNRGPLEMFACPSGTKEHESIVAVNALSSQVHAALLAIGTEKGKPAQWDPEYRPASGPTVDIQVKWKDDSSNEIQTRPAREMVRNARTRKPMTQQWVFGGSEIWEDPANGDKIYYGDAGELICLSNFSTATMDINVESSQSNDGLLFETLSENIPALGTKVYLILTPGEPIGESDQEDGNNSESTSETVEKK